MRACRRFAACAARVINEAILVAANRIKFSARFVYTTAHDTCPSCDFKLGASMSVIDEARRLSLKVQTQYRYTHPYILFFTIYYSYKKLQNKLE